MKTTEIRIKNILNESEKAINVEVYYHPHEMGGKLNTWRFWIPKSQIVRRTETIIEIPEWLASKMGNELPFHAGTMSSTAFATYF